MYALLATRGSSARIVLPATKEIQPDWDLLAPVFHVTAKGEGPAIQTQVSEMTPGPGGWGLLWQRKRYVRKAVPELILEMGKG